MNKIDTKFRVVYEDDGLTPLPGFLDENDEPIEFGPRCVTWVTDGKKFDGGVNRDSVKSAVMAKRNEFREKQTLLKGETS